MLTVRFALKEYSISQARELSERYAEHAHNAAKAGHTDRVALHLDMARTLVDRIETAQRNALRTIPTLFPVGDRT